MRGSSPLSDLLDAGGDHELYFADRRALDASCPVYDPVVYRAVRSFLPCRDKDRELCVSPGAPPDSENTRRRDMFADLIVYQQGTLPGDEPFRSTGHWNLPGQLEIFETLTGRVLMLVGGQVRDGRPFLYEHICGPGDKMVVPFAVWHVSYVLEGPAAVLNITTDASDSIGKCGKVVADPGPEKYQRAGPIAVTARRRGSDHDFVGSPQAFDQWGRPIGSPRRDWLKSSLTMDESLADLHLYASPSRLASIERAAWGAYEGQWPLNEGFRHPP